MVSESDIGPAKVCEAHTTHSPRTGIYLARRDKGRCSERDSANHSGGSSLFTLGSALHPLSMYFMIPMFFSPAYGGHLSGLALTSLHFQQLHFGMGAGQHV
jgi:hypothetical protein